MLRYSSESRVITSYRPHGVQCTVTKSQMVRYFDKVKMEEGVAGHLYSFRMPGYIEWFKFRRFGLTTSMETGKIG